MCVCEEEIKNKWASDATWSHINTNHMIIKSNRKWTPALPWMQMWGMSVPLTLDDLYSWNCQGDSEKTSWATRLTRSHWFSLVRMLAYEKIRFPDKIIFLWESTFVNCRVGGRLPRLELAFEDHFLTEINVFENIWYYFYIYFIHFY